MKKFLYLYHGTFSVHKDSILKSGLRPRDFHGNSNYTDKLASKEGLVYLTQYFPIAYCSLFGEREVDSDYLILKVRVPVGDVFPDEDFIAKALAIKEGKDHDMDYIHELTATIDPRCYKKHWKLCLKYLGNLCVPKVDTKNIVAHFEVAKDDFETLLDLGYDVNPHAHIGILPVETTGRKWQNKLEYIFEHGFERYKEERERTKKRIIELCQRVRTKEEEIEYIQLVFGKEFS